MVHLCRAVAESDVDVQPPFVTNHTIPSHQVLPECQKCPQEDKSKSNGSVPGSLSVVPMHERPELMEDVAMLINSEWPRSMGARLAQLRSSSNLLPTCLLLLKNDLVVLGHVKLTPINSKPDACFVESVVVTKDCRGQGLGTLLMRHTELYCMTRLRLSCIYLSTVDQMRFYEKLGYRECEPISIYGNTNFRRPNAVPGKKVYMKRELAD